MRKVALRVHLAHLFIFRFGKLLIVCQDVTSCRTVPNEDRWGADPVLEIVERDWDVLGVITIENPELAIRGRLWDAVTVVIDERAFLLCSRTQGYHIIPEIINGRVKVRFVLALRIEDLELSL